MSTDSSRDNSSDAQYRSDLSPQPAKASAEARNNRSLSAMDKIQLPPTEAQLKVRAFCDTVIAEALAQAVREGVCVKTDEVQWSAATGRFEPVYRSLIFKE